ncbi:basic secretory protein-like protein [Coprobacter tertius]|uniref:T9SS type A sorting domain-containing protein n=1 Tax=Coprobacter tertius TaxID=2944915 RepID=A0ABT1MFW8_9BACT|nr:basic secretory protein-like protein [Coprobacter tertius]MCP9611249.1 T9SS type A sorting domain-containing protein [Coprobacter tertius]
MKKKFHVVFIALLILFPLKGKCENKNADPWENYKFGKIELVDNETDRTGSKIYHRLIPDMNEYIYAAGRDVMRTLYNDPSSPGVPSPSKVTLVYTLKSGMGNTPSAKWGGSDANGNIRVGIDYSIDYIEKLFRDASNPTDIEIEKFMYETKGVLLHEMTHALQVELSGYQTGNQQWAAIEGMADAVRYLNDHFTMADRPAGGNYLDGYRYTGFFFGWLTKEKNPEFIKRFNYAPIALGFSWNFTKAVYYGLNKTVNMTELWNEYLIAMNDPNAPMETSPLMKHYSPLTLSGFNVDIIAESGTLSGTSGNYTLSTNAYNDARGLGLCDGQGNIFYSQSVNESLKNGLPTDGNIVSDHTGCKYKLADYNKNNVLSGGGTLTLNTKVNASEILVLGFSVYNGQSPVTAHYTNGTIVTNQSIMGNWGNKNGGAYSAGLFNYKSGTLNDSDTRTLCEMRIVTDPNKTINKISISDVNAWTALFAVSALINYNIEDTEHTLDPNEDGVFHMNENSQLITENEKIIGQINYTYNFSQAQKWEAISFPFTLNSITDAEGNEITLSETKENNCLNVISYNPENNSWEYITSLSQIESDKGYLYALNGTGEITFTGIEPTVQKNFIRGTVTDNAIAGKNIYVNNVLKNSETTNVYVLEGNNFVLKQSVQLKPFQTYMVATEDIMSTTPSFEIGDISSICDYTSKDTDIKITTTHNQIQITTDGQVQVDLYTLQGQKILSSVINGSFYRTLDNGIYIVKIISGKGTVSKKVLIQD